MKIRSHSNWKEALKQLVSRSFFLISVIVIVLFV